MSGMGYLVRESARESGERLDGRPISVYQTVTIRFER